jgi:hypothetical protein
MECLGARESSIPRDASKARTATQQCAGGRIKRPTAKPCGRRLTQCAARKRTQARRRVARCRRDRRACGSPRRMRDLNQASDRELLSRRTSIPAGRRRVSWHGGSLRRPTCTRLTETPVFVPAAGGAAAAARHRRVGSGSSAMEETNLSPLRLLAPSARMGRRNEYSECTFCRWPWAKPLLAVRSPACRLGRCTVPPVFERLATDPRPNERDYPG